MNVLVAVAAYPTTDGKRPQYFIHSRNLYYIKNGISVTVLNFSSKKEYYIDEIHVISLEQYINERREYDLLICHAPNLRNHYRFLHRFKGCFKKTVFVFHGHEILHINKYYPKPYPYAEKKSVPFAVQDFYDSLKILVWKRYWLKNIEKIRLVFVSEWLRTHFYSETGIKKEQLKGHDTIISNSIGCFFEEHHYQPAETLYDYITVRSNLDGPSYSMDVVRELACQNSQYRFLVIGKGHFFDYYGKPNNVTWIAEEMTHEEIGRCINQSRFALIPTKHDSQGLMACEMASFGIPLITSDIEVCREVYRSCPRVAFIQNNHPELIKAVDELDKHSSDSAWTAYYAENTIMKEIQYIKEFYAEGEGNQ